MAKSPANTVKWFWESLFALIVAVLLLLLLFCPPPISHAASWGIAICVLVLAPWVVFQLSKYCSKTWLRLFFFAVILVSGSIFYSCDFRNQQARSVRQGEKPPAAEVRGAACAGKSEKPQGPGRERNLVPGIRTENCDYLLSTMIGVFAALAEFFPSRGSYRDWLTYSPLLKCAFLFFYLFSYMFVASFLLSLLGRKVLNRISLFWARSSNDRKYVFWCKIPDRKEILLAKDILEDDETDRCIFSVKESDIKDIHTFVNQMQFAGFLLCLRKPEQLHPDCLAAGRHFFLTDDLNWNFRRARKVLDSIREITSPQTTVSKAGGKWWSSFGRWLNFGRIPEKIDFYLRVTDDEKACWAAQWAEKMQKVHSFLTIHLINEEAIIARQLQLAYPLLKSPGIKIDHDACRVSGSFRILLLGFSDGGQAVLREMVCGGQFLHTGRDDGFSVDVVDRDAVLTGGYAARYRDAVRAYNISFINKEVLSGDFYNWLELNLHRYNRIIVSFWNDNLNLELAAIICRLGKYLRLDDGEGDYMRQRLYVRFSRMTGAGQNEASEAAADAGQNVFPFRMFGSIEACYSKKVIIAEDLDKKAMEVHKTYLKKHPGKGDWHTLDMFYQESSRSTADGYHNQLTLLGLTEDKLDPTTEFEPEDAQMEALAETGHLHWNAFQLMHGIRPWPLEGKVNHKANDIKDHLRHATIVDYDKLPEVGELVEQEDKDFQENERELVRNIGKVLCAGEDAQRSAGRSTCRRGILRKFREFYDRVAKRADGPRQGGRSDQ